MSLYTDLVDAGVKTSNWQSDLYCERTLDAIQIIKRHGLKATVFKNQVEGGFWLEVPFQFDPFWEARA